MSQERDPSKLNTIDLLSQGTPRDLRTLQVKLTYVGVQTKAVPSVVFTTFYHLVQMAWFLPLGSANLNYANDETSLWNFTVTPEEMKSISIRLAREECLGSAAAVPMPYLSLMLALRDSRLGEAAVEIILDMDCADGVARAIYDALDDDNGVGRSVIDSLQQLLL